MLTSELGIKLDSKNASLILSHVCSILGVYASTDEFIGSHPVSFTRQSLDILISEDYLVCEKSDGVRVMLIVYGSAIFVYDRKCAFFQTKYRLNINVKETYFFDGEAYKEDGRSVYAIFDCLIFKNENCTKKDLNKRLQRVCEFAQRVVPKSLLYNKAFPASDFVIIAKQMMKSYGFYQILDEISKLKHENDGLIFTPVADPYMLMVRTRMFKWKPPHLNTVDFYSVKTARPMEWKLYVSVEENQLSGCRTGYASKMLFFGTYYDLSGELGSEDVITEFSYDSGREIVDLTDFTTVQGGLSLYKVRSDKTMPNNIKTALNVIESIEEGIDEKELRKHWKLIERNYKTRNAKSQI